MYNPDAALVTLDDITQARDVLDKSPYCHRTPLISVKDWFDFPGAADIQLYLKLENTQISGSFKVRGVINQLHHVPPGYGTTDHKLLSMSAGNYGKAFAYITNKMGLSAKVIMPKTAPSNRMTLIRNLGAEVETGPTSELQNMVDKDVTDNNSIYLHSFDDTTLIAGHASAGLEILEEIPDPDIVAVCCGGGGFLAGVASAVKLRYPQCKVYGVEPEGSRTMHESYKVGHAVALPVKSIASGLSPPFAGANAYKHCQKYVEEILLVSDAELVRAMNALYRKGLVVEPSGAAAFAALYHEKIPQVKGKKIVIVITGGNVTPEELVQYNS